MHVPERVVTNDDLKAYYDTSDEWISSRSGIKKRHWVNWDDDIGTSDLALKATEKALENADLPKEDIDLIVFATLSPDAFFPGAGCYLQDKMGLETTPALDIRMQCSGFIYAISIAEQYIRTGMYKNILVVGAEVHSTGIDLAPEGRTVGVLFGDGAGAVVVQAREDTDRGVQSTHLYTEGKNYDKLWNPEPTSNRRPRITPEGKGLYPIMEGREVFTNAVRRMSEVVAEACKINQWPIESIDLLVPHQANLRISAKVGEVLGLPMEKVFSNIHDYGNTTAATIPICLAEANAQGRLKPGDRVMLVAFGSGFTWGAATVVW